MGQTTTELEPITLADITVNPSYDAKFACVTRTERQADQFHVEAMRAENLARANGLEAVAWFEPVRNVVNKHPGTFGRYLNYRVIPKDGQ